MRNEKGEFVDWSLVGKILVTFIIIAIIIATVIGIGIGYFMSQLT